MDVTKELVVTLFDDGRGFFLLFIQAFLNHLGDNAVTPNLIHGLARSRPRNLLPVGVDKTIAGIIELPSQRFLRERHALLNAGHENLMDLLGCLSAPEDNL